MEASPWYRPSDDPPFDRKVLRTIFTVVAVLLSIYLIYRLQTPLLWLTIAVFVSIAASGPVNYFSQHMKRGLAITIVYLMILLVPLGLSAALLPPLVTSAVDLVDQMPQFINDLQDALQKNKEFQKFDENFDFNQQLTNVANDLSGKLGDAASTLGDIGTALINSIFATFTVFVLSLFMVARGRRWIDEWLASRAGP
ncbi:MAG: AI-2E family transporter, partial [Solirubrobacterales bacterium]